MARFPLVAAALLLSLLCDTAFAGSVRMITRMEFATPSGTKKAKDLSLGKVWPEPNDTVIMDTDGKITLIGTGSVEDPYGTPGKIIISDLQNQEVNVLSMNYNAQQGLYSLQALCSSGKAGVETDCAKLPSFTGVDEKSYDIGVNLKVMDRIAPSSGSSFDMSVVYK